MEVLDQSPPRLTAPLTSQRLLAGNAAWPRQDLDRIIASIWAPWPGYYVDPMTWTMIIEADGPGSVVRRSDHLDRPIMSMRGYNSVWLQINQHVGGLLAPSDLYVNQIARPAWQFSGKQLAQF